MPPRPRSSRKTTAAGSSGRKATPKASAKKAAPARRTSRAAADDAAAASTASMVSREQVQAAKPAALRLFKRMKADVVGVGITRVQGQYALKVNLREPLDPRQAIPDRVDGVRLCLAVTGPITPG